MAVGFLLPRLTIASEGGDVSVPAPSVDPGVDIPDTSAPSGDALASIMEGSADWKDAGQDQALSIDEIAEIEFGSPESSKESDHSLDWKGFSALADANSKILDTTDRLGQMVGGGKTRRARGPQTEQEGKKATTMAEYLRERSNRAV